MVSDQNVYWVARLAIHDGQDEAFGRVVEEMCAATANEEGVLNYEWSLSEDGRTCHVLERYADSDAASLHREYWWLRRPVHGGRRCRRQRGLWEARRRCP